MRILSLAAALLVGAAVAAPPTASFETPTASVRWTPMDPNHPDGPSMAFVAGDMETGPVGVLLRFPGGSKAPQHKHTADYTGATLQGTHAHGKDAAHLTSLPAGSVWFQRGGEAHADACLSKEPCVIFVQFHGKNDMIPVQP